MVALGNECSVNTHAILTDMNTPLGRAAGNSLEMKESVDCLENKGPDDLRQLVVDSAAHLLIQTKKTKSLAAARKLAADCLNFGEPRQKWDEILIAQGADLQAFNQKLLRHSIAPVVLELKSPRAGFISCCDAKIVGEVIRDLGGGHLTKDSQINYDAGVDRITKPGEHVEKNSVLARIHAADRTQAEAAVVRLKTAFEISARRHAVAKLIHEVI